MIRSRAKCPACKKIIDFDKRHKVREFVTCPFCQNILEVVSEHPQKLDWAEDPLIVSSLRSRQKLY
ncbi:MAG: hypothetical protein ISR58_19895 [Anaerolineales bacterium]|nr:hypothetical protein [Chloroflexota bacterium]MBL6983448.1 hypothetical protein [Anaerolineales bacterium]